MIDALTGILGSKRPTLALAVLAAGCAGEASKPTGEPSDGGAPPAVVCAGLTCLEADAEAMNLRLRFDGDARVELGAGAFEIGVESAILDERSYDPTYPQPATRWATLRALEVLEVGEGALELRLRFEGGGALRATATPIDDGALRLNLAPDADESTELEGVIVSYRVGLTVGADEAFYGLGEWFDRPEHRGAVRPMHIVADLASESSYNEAHVPVPLLIGTAGWGLLAATDRPTVFDVAATAADRVGVTVGTGPDSDAGVELQLYAAPTPLDVTARYYAATGAPLLPAPWALGPLLWRDENIDQAEVLADIEQLRARDLPASGIWIDRPYASGVNTFDFNPALYPDPAGMVGAAHDAGLRVAVWHTPYLDPDETGALYDEAEAQGYFPPEVPIVFNSWSEPIDFTQPAAVAFWQGLIDRYTALGIEGYKLDYGEDVILGINGARLAWRFGDGSDERTMHKGYMRGYHQTYADTLPSEGGLLLCRAGTWGDQVNASVIWPGDLDADMALHREPREDGSLSVGGLPAAVSAAAGLGPSGFPFFGSDTGGYRHSPPNTETLIRWFEHTALSAVMQVGNSASGQPWELLNDEELSLYRDYSRLHLRLFPLIWTLSQGLLEGGRPILRPFGLQEPALGQHPADVYFFGEDLLVAPVVTPGATTRALPRPAGDWIGWFDGAPLPGAPGDTVEVPAPLERLPLYLRVGGVIPLLRPTIDTLAPVADPSAVDSFDADPGRLWARVAVGADGAAGVFDGARLTMRDDGATITIEMTPGAVFTQGFALELLGLSGPPSAVLIDGAAATDWAQDGPLLIVPAASRSVELRR